MVRKGSRVRIPKVAPQTMAKRLYRSTTERMIAGVCGGLADYFDADPTIVRLLFVILALFGIAPAVILYLVMWIIVPELSDVEK